MQLRKLTNKVGMALLTSGAVIFFIDIYLFGYCWIAQIPKGDWLSGFIMLMLAPLTIGFGIALMRFDEIDREALRKSIHDC